MPTREQSIEAGYHTETLVGKDIPERIFSNHHIEKQGPESLRMYIVDIHEIQW